MENTTISAITARINSFPTLPSVVTRVMEVTADPESSANDLMTIISQDQSLTITILKMANSAFFGMVKKVSSLQHAVSVLGFKAIRNVVLARSVFKSFKDIGSKNQFDIRAFWEHSFLCGLSAKIIAQEFKGDKNDFFVAGLIHDIGKLVIYMALPMKFSEIVNLSGSPRLRTFDAEKEVLGITHDDVGMDLLDKWLFPEELVASVGFHHQPHKANAQSQFALAVYAADLLAHISESQDDEEAITGMKDELFSPEIVSLFQSHKIEWNEADLEGFQNELRNIKEEEAGALSILTGE